MSSGITAVVTHYWSQRAVNFDSIFNGLTQGSLIPDAIIIWDNTGTLELPAVPWETEVIRPTMNHGCIARFTAATLAKTPWVLTQDNDVMVERGTLENLMQYAH